MSLVLWWGQESWLVTRCFITRKPKNRVEGGSRWGISFGDEYCKYLFAPRVVQRPVD